MLGLTEQTREPFTVRWTERRYRLIKRMRAASVHLISLGNIPDWSLLNVTCVAADMRALPIWGFASMIDFGQE